MNIFSYIYIIELIIENTMISKFTSILILALLISSIRTTRRMNLDWERVHEIQKAQIYLQKQLIMYEKNRTDNYTLFLAVKNYANRLGLL